LLFYVQHQFEDVYWARHDGWDSVRVALEGSSYLKLPKVLQWFTGNIGLHQIHQVRPNIANYTYNSVTTKFPALISQTDNHPDELQFATTGPV
jgi:omega-6 fatty acid desaturase (delta-12 desaturase)